jgi:ketosteroid isomerase-like protein
MRHPLTILGTLAAGLVACSSETVAMPPPAPVNWQSLELRPVADAGVDIVTAKERALPEAYAASLASPGELEGGLETPHSSIGFADLAALLDEDAHFASPGMQDAHGRRGILLAHEALLGAFDHRHVAVTRVWRTPREQTVEWTMTGNQARDYMGIAASQKPVAFKGLTLLWTQDDGRITDIHVYIDVAVVKAQLGVGVKALLSLPPPALPSGPTQAFEQAPTPSADELGNVRLVRSWLDALENRREAEFVGAVDDDVELTTLERPQASRGAEAMKTYYTSMHKAVGQLDTTVTNAWGVGSYAILEYSIAGDQMGPIGWIPAQRDKVIRLELVDICEIRGGKIARVWRYDNPGQIAERPFP